MTENRLLFHETIKSQSLEQISSHIYPDRLHCIIIVYFSTVSPLTQLTVPLLTYFNNR